MPKQIRTDGGSIDRIDSSLGFTTTAHYAVRDAKGEVERRLGSYSPRVDQARLVSQMDVNQALTVPHLQRLGRKLGRIVH